LSIVANIYSPDPRPGQERAAFKLDAPAEAAVLRLAKDKESLIRADAIELLGETQDKKYADVFYSALNDRSYSVIDQASSALGHVKDPRAFDALSKLVATPSWKGRIMIAGLSGLAALDDKRGFDVAYKIATDTNVPRSIRTNALEVVGATGKGDPRAYPLIFDQFKKAFDANNIQGIINGLNAITSIADPRGQQAFDMMKEKFKGNTGAMNFINGLEAQFKAAIGK
jgi:HEAT repeat protein